MDVSRLIALIGNLLYASGLLLMVYSYRYNSKVMVKAALGVAIIASNEGSPEWREKFDM